MSSASAAQTSVRLRVPETVRIVNWPLRYGGFRVWLTGLVMVGLGVGAGRIANNPAMGAVCFAALMGSSWRLWLPVRFVLGTKGVTQSTLVFHWRIPWRCFARYEKRPRGVWLMTDPEPAPLSTLRGIYLRCTDEETPQLLAVLDFFLAARRQRAANTTRTYAS